MMAMISSQPRPFATGSRFGITFVALLALLFGTEPRSLCAQGADPKKVAVESVKKLPTSDGWQIEITYYGSTLGANAPVVLLMHSLGGNRKVWEGAQGFAKRLQREGYAVVTVDLRKHGQSVNPSEANASDSSNLKVVDYHRMIDTDLEAVKEFLFKEHSAKNLNMNKMAIIAPDSAAPIAINYTAFDWLKRPYPDGPTPESSTPRGQDIRALVLLSPEANLKGLTTAQALLQIRNPEWGIGFLACVGEDDDRDRGDARKIAVKLAGVTGAKDRVLLQVYNKTKFRGTDLLGKKGVNCEDDILYVLKKHVMDLPVEWRDRTNRLTGK
ncbi:MAG: alpha/beta hydrolase [Planctomycetaceae bacterium]